MVAIRITTQIDILRMVLIDVVGTMAPNTGYPTVEEYTIN